MYDNSVKEVKSISDQLRTRRKELGLSLTDVARRVGHRVSVDLDFFRCDGADVRHLHDVLSSHGTYETLQEAEHKLTVLIRQTKLSFFCVKDSFDWEECKAFFVREARGIVLPH